MFAEQRVHADSKKVHPIEPKLTRPSTHHTPNSTRLQQGRGNAEGPPRAPVLRAAGTRERRDRHAGRVEKLYGSSEVTAGASALFFRFFLRTAGMSLPLVSRDTTSLAQVHRAPLSAAAPAIASLNEAIAGVGGETPCRAWQWLL